MRRLWLFLMLFALVGATKDKEKLERDFEYKELPLFKVIEGLAKLDGKSVIFSRSIENRPISLSLTGITSDFALKLILENYGYIAVPKGEVLHIMTSQERGVASVPNAIMIPLKNVIAKDILANLQAYLGQGASITINEQMNSLIITAPDETLTRARRLVAELDQEVTQVFIEAKVIETSTSFARSLGIEWGSSNGTGGIDRSTGISVTSLGSHNTVTAVVSAAGLQTRLAAGEENGDVKVVSSPKIATLNGISATIDSSTTYSIRTLAAVPGSAGGATNQGAIQSVRAGVRLVVTPYVVSDDQVRLNIQLNKSDPDFARAVDNIPGISDNSATTSLIVKNGQMASIGGLIYHSDTHNRNKVPILGDMPILGYIFGNDVRSKAAKELLIFITPTVFHGNRAELGAGLSGDASKSSIGSVNPQQKADEGQAKEEEKAMVETGPLLSPSAAVPAVASAKAPASEPEKVAPVTNAAPAAETAPVPRPARPVVDAGP